MSLQTSVVLHRPPTPLPRSTRGCASFLATNSCLGTTRGTAIVAPRRSMRSLSVNHSAGQTCVSSPASPSLPGPARTAPSTGGQSASAHHPANRGMTGLPHGAVHRVGVAQEPGGRAKKPVRTPRPSGRSLEQHASKDLPRLSGLPNHVSRSHQASREVAEKHEAQGSEHASAKHGIWQGKAQGYP